MPPNLPEQFRIPRSKRAFALVVTLLLMGLLVLIGVSFAALTRVEIQIARNSQQLAQAQNNALVGLNVALGELQRSAGPDQRITATAGILATAHPSKRNWTGVWDVDQNHNSNLSNSSLPITSAGLNPAWLVSHSNPAEPPSIEDAAPTLAPSENYSDSTVRLLGAGSVDISLAGNEIIVPLQDLRATGLPGYSGSQLIGKFGYWVGDEGVKARINLDSPGFKSSATSTEAAYAFAGAPRASVESMERSANPASGTTTSPWGTSLYPYAHVNSPKADTAKNLLVREQLPLYCLAGNEAATQSAARSRFHDITAHSASVLSDTANGGLRQDLTRILADPTKGPSSTERIAPVPTGATEGINAYQRLPNWGRLRAWWGNPVDAATGSLTPSAPNNIATDYATPVVAPILVWCGLGIEIFYEDLGAAASPNRYRLRTQLFPQVALWNPYSVPFSPAKYILNLEAPYSFVVQIRSIGIPNLNIKSVNITKFSFSSLTFGEEPSTIKRSLYFTLNVPALAAGETKVLSLTATNAMYDSTSSGTTLLAEGDSRSNYVYLNTVNEVFDTSVAPSLIDPNKAYEYVVDVNPKGGGKRAVCLQDSNGSASPIIYQNVGLNGLVTLAVSDVKSIRKAQPMPQQLPIIGHSAVMSYYGIRWLANCNILGSYQYRHGATDGTYVHHYMGASSLPANPMVTSQLVGNLDGVRPLIIREPRLADSGYYQSIAQLQHAPLSDNANTPLYAVGNSLQNPRITRAMTYCSTNAATEPLFDISYLLNQELWDKYFFSTVPNSLVDAELATTTYKLPNSRLYPLSTADAVSLKGHDTASSKLLLLGGFNINSISEQAWRAVLSAAQGIKYNPRNGLIDPTKALQSPFSRFLSPRGESVDGHLKSKASSDPEDTYNYQGYRELSDVQIAALASAIVSEVKLRGPFRSIADFVNRRLVTNTDPAAATGLKGALQAAIDGVDLDVAAINRINAIVPYTKTPSTPLSAGWGTKHDLQADVGTTSGVAESPISGRNVFGPGYVTQADVLARIGSAISARSDTFVIRTYGESRNPVLNEVTGRAWAEAVVQRLPEYINTSTAPETPKNLLSPGSDNAVFGRRFKVINFRWLGTGDI